MSESANYKITTGLTFQTAPDLLAQSRTWIVPGAGEVTLDLAGAGRTDSAGIALMLEWIEMARRNDTRLHLVNLPVQTSEFIEANGLESLFSKFTG